MSKENNCTNLTQTEQNESGERKPNVAANKEDSVLEEILKSTKNLPDEFETRIKDGFGDCKQEFERFKNKEDSVLEEILKSIKKLDEFETRIKDALGDSKQEFERFKNKEDSVLEEILKSTKNLPDEFETRIKDALGDCKQEFERFKTSIDEVEEGVRRNNTLLSCYTLLALKTILLVAIVGVYISNKSISEVGSCDLKTALDSIHLNYNFQPCAHSVMKDSSSSFYVLRLLEVVSNSCLALFIIIVICLSHCRNENRYLFSIRKIRIIVIFCAGIGALPFFVADCGTYLRSVEKMSEKKTEIDFRQLQSLLLSSLEENYKSDNITAGDMMSTSWNIFFIRYDCCAVREVQGTSNDFDNTPWCTTSGSCQATFSQIPKTCCKYVTQDDYQNAPSLCHASVNPGTYKQNCIGRLRKLSVYNIEEWQVLEFWIFLSIKLLLQALTIVLSVGLLVCEFFFNKCKRKTIRGNRRNQEDNSQFTILP
uniref:Uncharacterized protein LOC111123550 isoform X2 n=1 Tax=Crassostrea virginica TaxID=6565 RepID=A0A8B8D4B6_CRAVI|nr:uncharacterized protein LOC111123550 isoform X2 [Crassostrea virginica]